MVNWSPANASDEQDHDAQASVVASRFLAQLSDRYVVDRRLGEGGMGVVHLARDARLGRPVAIKVLYPAVAGRIGADRFLGEVRLTAALQHPHILPVLDSDCVDGVCYYITPYLPEGSLQRLIDRHGRLSLEEALRIALDVLEALEYAHAQGIVHCDIKPENILLSNGHAVLADFGIARTMHSLGRKASQGVCGSPAYMSPEQASGEVNLDERSDLYSLACVFHDMLTGSPAFTGPSAQAVIAKRFSAPVPRLDQMVRSVPPEVTDAVAKALALDPAERFPTARAFGVALAAGLGAALPVGHRHHRANGLRPMMARWMKGAGLVLALLISG